MKRRWSQWLRGGMGSSAFAVGGAWWCRSELTHQIAMMEPVKHEATWWERCRWWVGVGGSRRRDSSMDIGGSRWLSNSSVSGLVADGLAWYIRITRAGLGLFKISWGKNLKGTVIFGWLALLMVLLSSGCLRLCCMDQKSALIPELT